MEEWEDRYIEILDKFNWLGIHDELHLHNINTLRVERDGLGNELEYLRRTIDEMWHHELHITSERDDFLNTTHELQRAILTKNQELENLLADNKKLQSVMLTQCHDNISLLKNKLLRALFIQNFDDMHIHID